MKKSIIAILMATMSLTSFAQNAVIKGKFTKILPQNLKADRVIFSKQEAGGLSPISMATVARQDQSFSTQVPASDLNAIRYLGYNADQYPVYMHAGEELTLDAFDGNVVYSGNLSKENKVFADWYKLVLPLQKFGHSNKGYTIPTERLTATLDSLAAPVDAFVKSINTGNEAFDKYVKFMLPYSVRYDALLPFSSGINFGRKDEYPAYFTDLFKNERYADKAVWTLPFGFDYIMTLSFAKHIIYNSENGMASELVLPEISNKELLSEVALKAAEKGLSMDLVAFTTNSQKYMLTDAQKKTMSILTDRAKLKVAGGQTINFSYPNINGKTSSLSDYRGKVVLLDVWATWCAPCIAEQPALETLEKSFEGKNVVFISLSIDTDKAKWKDMVEKKKLSGVHLFTNNKGPIVTDYEVTEIPRYILIDKEGKMVSFDAPRPSDAKLKALIESKL
ncbi:TlpA family protein disulfide reductase [Pedobacter sp. WC2501]|uniref:TlpA family protein disulfide reductase n=1 Tax=Pedobacter sp. WC2501 TaxID=3461400 RepID=UPI0040464D6C